MVAKWLGRFREISGCSDDPPITDAVGVISEDKASAVGAYLRSGLGLIDVMEILPDVIDGSLIRESASILGDGNWIWRADLAHYVEKYCVGLDPYFLESMVLVSEHVPEARLEKMMQEAWQLWQGQ